MATKLYTILFLLTITAGSVSSQTITAGDAAANPGEKISGFLYVQEGSDGPEVRIPVTVVNGVRPGPALALIAGTHGYEYAPIIALQRVKQELESEALSGTVIIVHIANMPSFTRRTIYLNPYDWKNLNRAYPGKIDGSMTERIAYTISKEVIDQSDYVIDNHCGDGNEDLTTYLYYTETGNPGIDRVTRELALNFGFKLLIHERAQADEPAASWCANSALFKGKPALTVECGKLGRTDETDIGAIVNGTYNTLKYLDMIDGNPEKMFESIWVEKTMYVYAEHDGLFYPLVKAGQHVQQGEMAGYLTDYFGNVIQKAYAPQDGIVMYIVATPPMSAGGPMVKVGGFSR
ncbi:succinylglutamate desuccinylase/aspartoacylase family protein [candidate division KSB1 bacterium]